MKKVLLFAVMAVMSMALFAQPPGGGQRMTVEERAKAETEWMKKELKLTEKQIAPVDSINLLYTKAQHVLFETMRDGGDVDREKMRESIEALQTEKDKALAEVLTEDQVKTYKKVREERRQNMRREGRGNRPNR